MQPEDTTPVMYTVTSFSSRSTKRAACHCPLGENQPDQNKYTNKV